MSQIPNNWGDNGSDNYADLDQLGAQFKPEHQFRLSTDTLADGDYDFQVLDAKLDRTKNGKRLVRVGLALLLPGGGLGRVVEKSWFIDDQRGVNGFGADMAALGFASKNWGMGPGQVPLSRAIPDTVAKLMGCKLRATKSKRTKDDGSGGHWHDFAINGPLTGAPMPQAPRPAAAPAPAPEPTYSHQDIPF